MLKPISIFELTNKYICISFLLLIPFNSTAYQHSPVAFEQIIEQVEKLHDISSKSALELLNSFKISPSDLTIEQRIQFYKLLADIYADLNQYQLSLEISNKGLALAKNLTSPSIIIAELLYVKGFASESTGDMDAAELDYENGLDIAKSLNDKVNIAYGLINLGAVYYLTDRLERSLSVFNDAYTLASQTDDENLKGSINSELGILYAMLWKTEKSLDYYQQSYEHYLKADNKFYAYNSLRNIARAHSDNGDYEKSIEANLKVINEAKDILSNSMLYGIYSDMSWALLKQKVSDPEASYKYILLAEEYVTDNEQYNIGLYHLISKADILEGLKRYDEALTAILEAEVKYEKEISELSKDMYSYLVYIEKNIYYGLGQYKEAYNLKTQLIQQTIQFYQQDNLLEIEELRLRYESEQADLLNKILEEKKSLNTLELDKADKTEQKQRLLLLMTAVFALVFAWLLIKVVYGHKSILKASRTDSLTGILNRRRLMQLGERLVNSALNKMSPLCILMIDVDHFKHINDSLGHSIGDMVLKEMSKTVNDTMRKTDVFGRFGGEEFIILLPNTPLEQAKKIAERIRVIISNHQWGLAQINGLSISLGLCAFEHEKHQHLEDLIKCADMKLYQAKDQGRNRVVE